ncbi:MAG TPA: anaerobic sulfatase maturase [Firmicutes bacterium]|jgi:uncharacterized protein|nr:MAG: hypothetical protein AA931_06115 [Peptococcaceae bacterium 1109]HHT72238.1 anaerobic sulfatase maturase [Bacillota bacterium]
MVKPIGPICNLHCEYCFYLHKKDFFPDSAHFQMSDIVLERFIKEYIHSQPGPVVPFAWQGGEPTLMGLDFFRKVVRLQKEYIPEGWHYTNSLQTNGTLIDHEWARFLKEEGFLVGISLDGPEPVHDMYRKDRSGLGTWGRVVEGFRTLQRYGVSVNVLCVVNRENGARPKELYQFLKELGAEYVQFIPLVEWLENGEVSHRSLTGPLYGKFLIEIFNEWVQADLGQVFVQIFETVLSVAAGLPGGLCVFLPECGRQLVMEHNGDLYGCDHFVAPEYRLGNILEAPLLDLVNSKAQLEFGREKASLPAECLECPVVSLCNGGCPKNRHRGEEGLGLNWLCAGYKQFFIYVAPFARVILHTLQQGKTAEQAMAALTKLLRETWDVSRNDPCPCRSGLKYKKCCGR